MTEESSAAQENRSAERSKGSRRARLELLAVLATGGLHLVFEEILHAKTAFIVAALTGWGTYLVVSIRRDRGVLREWGLRLEGLKRDARGPALIVVTGAGLLAAVGSLRGTLILRGHMLFLLALYPIWGIAQQFLVQALVARNLEQLFGRRVLVVFITAVLFGLVHWPDTFLMPATFALALVFTPLYLRDRSLVPLGIAHGWLGVLAYYWLLGRDPWLELF